MKTTYTPRRASLTRWLSGAPEYVLDCFDHPKESDRFTIMLTGSQLGRMGESKAYGDTYVMALCADPEGRASWYEFKAHDASGYRYRNSRHRIAWADVPEAVRKELAFRIANQ